MKTSVTDFNYLNSAEMRLGPTEREASDLDSNVRFETTQKHQRAVTKQIQRVGSNSLGIKLFHQEPVYHPLSKAELLVQRHQFDLDFYDRMLKKEYEGRLMRDYFGWQTKVDKLMRVTLLCWMSELCTDMRFQKTTYHIALTYTDKFFEATPTSFGPEELQLIGVTAVYIAAKVEEVFVPTVKVFSKSTNYSSSVKRIC